MKQLKKIFPRRNDSYSRDLLSREFEKDPSSVYRAWRTAGGLQYFERNNAWVVLDYDIANTVLRDASSFSSSPFRFFSALLHGADAPAHTALRRILQPFFTPARQTVGIKKVEEITRKIAARIANQESFALISEFVEPIAVEVGCDWLGLEPSAGYRLLQMPANEIEWSIVEPALTDGFLVELARGGDVPVHDLGPLTGFFLAAAINTPRDFLGPAVHALAGNPELLRSLNSSATDWNALVDELVRLEPPVHAVLRSTTRDVELNGRSIAEGSTVWVSLAAANRDPARYDRPDEIIPGRSGPRSLAVGAGPHFCLGNHLGRMESAIALSRLGPLLDPATVGDGRPSLIFDAAGLPVTRRAPEWRIPIGRQ